MRWRIALSLVFIFLSLLLTLWPTDWQPFIETVYGQALYPILQGLLKQLPSPKQFALVDTLWLLLPLLLLIRFILLWRRHALRRLLLLSVELGLWLSTLYLLYMLMWGLNYHRPSLYHGLAEQGFTTQLVDGHWQFALQQTEQTLQALPTELDVCEALPELYNRARPAALAHSAMATADLKTAPNRNVSLSAWSAIYTRLGVAGVYMPFTGEPTANKQVFPLSLPFVMTHEYAHWAGYAREYDADIIAYWSLWLSPDPVWQLSGWVEWWMGIHQPETVTQQFSPELKNVFSCYSAYLKTQPRWQIRKLAWHAYESNLKTQGVKQGLASYRMGEAMALSSYQDWLFKKRHRVSSF